MPDDDFSQAQLVALRRIELIEGARQRSQHIHAAVATVRGGEPSPGASRARALLEVQQRVVASVVAQRQALEDELAAPAALTLEETTVEDGGLEASRVDPSGGGRS